jgi:hypothetical protein
VGRRPGASSPIPLGGSIRARSALNWLLFLSVCFEPESAGDDDRISSNFPPPIDFIAAAVHFAVVPSTQRDGELITDLASEGAALGKSKMVSIRGSPPAD